ncbi:MAG: hypothetical protein KC561_17265, partial [Myxococcales bacterium]|nr:hypothetical protein [Myxococcales bacterium]
MSTASEKLAKVLSWDAGGVRVAGVPLWMDARRRREMCVISHAHADHVGDHNRTLATPETLQLLGWKEKTGA